jgi:5-methylcytosine-specific restriction protein A
MTKDRLPANRGWAKTRTGMCRWCGRKLTAKRRTFCGEECVHEWKCRTDPGYQATQVLKRDGGVCALCSRNCLALERELLNIARMDLAIHMRRADTAVILSLLGRTDLYVGFHVRCDQLGLSKKRRLQIGTRRFWDMDHRVPVAEGGGACGLENLRTLCWVCHDGETAKLRARLRGIKKTIPRKR